MKTIQAKNQEITDITLILEGTYPYVQGGVSSWVHQIIKGLPELTFSLLFLGGSKDNYDSMVYELPPNVVHLETHFLMDFTKMIPPQASIGKKKPFEEVSQLLDFFKNPEFDLENVLETNIITLLGDKEGISREEFLFSKKSWDLTRNCYNKFCADPSFIDYFWTVRTMHSPLFYLADIARRAPESRVYHSVSTGYAGFLGMLLRQYKNRNYVLTEHGIYTKERKIDLGQAEWIKETKEPFSGALESGVGYLRTLWIRFFQGIGRLTYNSADPIIALYEGNRQRQINDGANSSKTMVIPNGIDLNRYSKMRTSARRKIPPILGLIGRVVPIKDIKTFIRGIRTLCNRIPNAEGWIIGPQNEDKDYVQECLEIVKNLDLEQQVKFLGFQKVEYILPKLGLLTLTSISEALPLVILEGFAAGLPALTTDVGSCRELIEGNSPEDRALGKAGEVVSIANPDELAFAAYELLTNPDRWNAAQKAGIDRVEKYYTQTMMLDRYRDIYEMSMGA